MGVFRSTFVTAGALLVLATAGVAGCTKSNKSDGSASGASPSVNLTPSASSPPPAASPTGGGSDWCGLTEQFATASGLMVNKHYISPLKETLEMLKAGVALALTNKAQLMAAVPASLRAAAETQMQYFQALQDSNFTAGPPAGFGEASTLIRDYQIATCGFVFDE